MKNIFRTVHQSFLATIVLGLIISLNLYAQEIGKQDEKQIGTAQSLPESETAKKESVSTKTDSEKSVTKSMAQSSDDDENWTGFYLGGNFGYSWGKGRTGYTPLPSPERFEALRPVTLETKPKGVSGGFQVGYNHQFGKFVIGAETDLAWTRGSDTVTQTPIILNNGLPFLAGSKLETTQSIKSVGTVRPRVGVALNRVLIYGTAGLAYGKVETESIADFRNQFNRTLPYYPFETSKFQKGWTAGFGTEIAVSKNFSLKAEYLYVNLGENTVTLSSPEFDIPTTQLRYDFSTTTNIFRTGFNIRF